MNLLRDNPGYTRLPGGGRTPTGKASFWLATDHLLVVEVQFVTESYRRFDLREIQAVTLAATRAHWLKSGIWGFLLLLFLAWGTWGFTEEFSNGFSDPTGLAALCGMYAISLAALTGLLLSLRAGSGCRVELQTSVQTVVLPAMARWRKAEKFIAALVPAVQAAQAKAEGRMQNEETRSQEAEDQSPNRPFLPPEP